MMKISFQNTQTLSYFLGVPILFFLATQLIGFDGLYGQDSYEYLRYANAIQNYITEGKHPGPFYWPVLYPLLGSLFGLLFGNIATGMQLVTCLSFGIGCLYVFKILQLLYPKKNLLNLTYVSLFGLLSPYFLKAGLVVMSDVTASMFVILMFYHFLNSYYKKTSLTLVFFFATCALMTRYATLMITIPVILSSIYFVFKEKGFKNFLIGTIISIAVCIPFIILQWDNIFEGTSNYFLNSWSLTYFLKSNYITIDGIQSYRYPNLIFVLYVFIHPGFIFIGFILACFAIKKRNMLFSFSQNIFAISIGIYLLFLAGIPFQNIRVLGLIFPITLLFLYPAYIEFIQLNWLQKYISTITIATIIIQLVFFVGTFKNVYHRTLFEKEICATIAPYQGNTLYGFDYDIAIKGRGLDFCFKNMYKTLYNDFKINDLVLFNPSQLTKQWKGKKPIENWNRIEQSYQLNVLEKFKDGWNLYQINSKK